MSRAWGLSGLLLASLLLPGQEIRTQAPVLRYFNLDSLVTLKGTVADLRQEARDKGQSFAVLLLKTPDRGLVAVELAPTWFFQMDLFAGARVEVTGSLLTEEGRFWLLASSLTFQGERVGLRDDLGFPLWRGGKGRGGPLGEQDRRGRARGGG